MLTPSPASAPSSTGRRLRRFAPSRLAVIAARISTASRPSRKTMIAALVMTVAFDAESPSVAATSRQLVVELRARGPDLAPRRAARDEIGEPLVIARAEPDQALDLGGQRGVERLQAALGPELEDRVELHPRLLGLAVAAGGHLLLEPVERDLDQVEVALVGLLLPGVGIERRQALADRLGPRLHVAGLRDRARALLRAAQDPVERVQPRADVGGGAPVDALERAAQVREGRARGGRERQALLDLERDRDPRALDPVAVLDRDQRDELRELVRAPGELLGGERRGGEAAEDRARPLARGLHRGVVVAQRRAAQVGEGRRRLRAGGGAALGGIARGELRPGARHARGELGAVCREAALAEPADLLDPLARLALGRVEQVLQDGEPRLRAVQPAALELAQRDRRVRAGARVAGRRAELAQQQPAPRPRGVAGLDGGQRGGGGAAQQRGLHVPARRGQRGQPARAARVAQARQHGAMRRRIGRADAGAQRPAVGAPRRDAPPPPGPARRAAAPAGRRTARRPPARRPATAAPRRPPGRRRRAPSGRRPRGRRRRAALRLELDPELGGGLGDLAGDRLRAVLGLRAERVGLLGVEARRPTAPSRAAPWRTRAAPSARGLSARPAPGRPRRSPGARCRRS